MTYRINFFCDILDKNINWEKVKQKYEMIICHILGGITVKSLGGLFEPSPCKLGLSQGLSKEFYTTILILT